VRVASGAAITYEHRTVTGPSKMCHTGFQYTPIASIATWVTP
jgi:hypothetical protein